MVLRIKKLRTDRGITQGQLAVDMGVAQSVLCMWETEAALPRTRDLPRLAEALGCTIGELFGEEAAAG